MLDACVVAPGGFPHVTGGLSRWVEVVCLGLSDLELGVWSIGKRTTQGFEFSVPRNVRELKQQESLAGAPPEAALYLVCGPLIVDWAEQFPHLLQQTVYVEHGDQARELSIGAFKCEAGNELHERAVASLLAQRDRAARACRRVVGVHRRTRDRLGAASGALTIANAVPPVHTRTGRKTAKTVRFIGRACRVKGVDRVNALRRVTPELQFELRGPKDAAPRPLLQKLEDSFEDTVSDPWSELPRAVVMPSRSESSPFVALEAEARGVHVLITPGAELGASSLIKEVPWSRDWQGEVRAAVERPLDPQAGMQLATFRWHNFTTAWKRLLDRPHTKGDFK